MDRRAFLGISGLVISGGCMNGDGGTATEPGEDTVTSTEASATPTESSTTSESPEDTATTTDGSTTTMSETSAPPAEICAETVQLESLSQDAQEEFTTALEEGELDGQQDEFQFPEEVSNVEDEVGQETCIRYEGEWYYARYGELSSDGVYRLSIHPASEDAGTATPSETGTTNETTTGESE